MSVGKQSITMLSGSACFLLSLGVMLENVADGSVARTHSGSTSPFGLALERGVDPWRRRVWRTRQGERAAPAPGTAPRAGKYHTVVYTMWSPPLGSNPARVTVTHRQSDLIPRRESQSRSATGRGSRGARARSKTKRLYCRCGAVRSVSLSAKCDTGETNLEIPLDLCVL